MNEKTFNIAMQLVGIIAWIWLFSHDGEIALVIFLIVWANNITISDQMKRL